MCPFGHGQVRWINSRQCIHPSSLPIPFSKHSLSLLFDCGNLGSQSIAAHGHADALSFTLRAFGQHIFVDPGTYDYFRYPDWRDYFRSTCAHNTLMVDARDQSEMLGPFLWGRRAEARCVSWEPRPNGGRVIGEHDGYAQLADPVIHRRCVDFDGELKTLTVTDSLSACESYNVK
ncbi:MAG: hypothetical protein FJ147_21580 [Deltaproteobacteria bacterium]|nr:hypothetical protein [Deltaproteobacteria bacterium]